MVSSPPYDFEVFLRRLKHIARSNHSAERWFYCLNLETSLGLVVSC